MGRVEGTFKAFNLQELKEKRAPSTKNVDKETEETTQQGLAKKRGRPR